MTISEIAEKLNGSLEGDGDTEIRGIASLGDAETGDLSFVANPKYARDAARTGASAVLVSREWREPCPAVLIRVDNPDAAFAEIAPHFARPPVQPLPGIHPTAVVAEDCDIGKEVRMGPYCVVESGAKIGDHTVIFAGCYIGHGAEIGTHNRLYSGVHIREYSQLGDRVIIHNGTVVGSDGFGYKVDEQGVRHKIPQVGIVVIKDDVEIGANVTIDRARFGRTIIGKGVKIDNLVQVAHNVVVGDHSVLCGQAGISGSTHLGRHVLAGGQAGFVGHLHIGDGAMIGAQAGVIKDVPTKEFVSGYPAMPHKKAMHIQAHANRLPELKARIKALEARLEKCEERNA